MSSMLWKIGEPSQLRQFVLGQDAKFVRAMRQELVALAADRGMKLVPKAATKPVQQRARLPRDIIVIAPSRPIEMPLTDAQAIIRDVCVKHGLTKTELLSARRMRTLVVARHEAMYRMSKETSMSLPMIGRRLGGRDHTTVLHGIRKYTAKLSAGSNG